MHQKNAPEPITPFLNNYYRTSIFQVGIRGFEGISPLWPPLPGKVIKLSFSILPKTLALRFNSVYREAECSAPEWQFLKRVANLAQPSVASKWNKLVQTQLSSESTLQVLSKKKEVI